MADDTKGKEVNLNSAEVPQHVRLAAGEKVDGQNLPKGAKEKPSTDKA